MADKELTVEQKLRALYDLQLIDARIDKIRAIRGELPLEVEDLEDEIAGLKTRLGKLNDDIAKYDADIKDKKNVIDDAKELIKRYEAQQKNVRNNREYDALSKEMEYQELEIQLAEKRIREAKVQIENKQQVIEQTQGRYEERNGHLEHKKNELDGILSETQKEEEMLLAKSEEYSQSIETRLYDSYKRIRNRVRNGLAVVSIDRGASEGSHFTIPPQRQMEIALRKRIITDEHSGRILVDPALADEEREKMDELFSNLV